MNFIAIPDWDITKPKREVALARLIVISLLIEDVDSPEK